MIDPQVIAASDLHKSGWEFSVYQRRRRHGRDTYVAAVRGGRHVVVSAETLETVLAEAAQRWPFPRASRRPARGRRPIFRARG